MKTLRWHDEDWVMMPERCVFRPHVGTLLVADPHFGKAESFRARGVPVPFGSDASTLAQLDRALSQTGASRLVILGDFLHAPDAQSDRTLARLRTWRDQHSDLSIMLIRGNHDIWAGDPAIELHLNIVDEPFVDNGVQCAHDAGALVHALPGVVGHVHPVVRLRDMDGTSLRLECFVVGVNRMTLPAFGRLTGGHPVALGRDDQVFGVVDGCVLDVSGMVRSVQRVRPRR